MSDFSSLLFIPFNKTKYFYNGLVSNADAIIVDFEDSVEYKSNDISITEIKKALSHISGKDMIARIGADDYLNVVESIGLDNFSGVMIPKFANKKEIKEVIENLINNSKKIYLLIEDAKGLFDLQFILSNFKIEGVFFGSEDYVSSLNVLRTEMNLQYARATIINLSKAFNVQCYDTIYPYLDDDNGLRKETQLAFEMGFDGKMAIHPKQLAIINETFKVSPEIILEYKALIKKYNEYTKKNNTKVMVIDSTVIESPHIRRMKAIIEKYEGRNDNE